MKVATTLVATFALIIISEALPLELAEWYQNQRNPTFTSLMPRSEIYSHQSSHVNMRKTRRHHDIDQLDTYQRFGENILFGVSRFQQLL
jgi:hypothetical protein